MNTYSWLTASQTTVVETGDANRFIPADPSNTDYVALVASGSPIAPYVPPAPPIPESISRRQFFQQLTVQGVATNAEALAAVATGSIPSKLITLVAGLPAAQQFSANMMISGNLTFERHHPLVETMGAAFGWTPAQIDACWVAASAL